MLNIAERSNEELTTLTHGADVFHKALEKVREGEERFHVTDPAGKVEDYDLTYIDNMRMFPDQILALILKMTNGGRTYATFMTYDEDDTKHICLEFLDQFKKIEIESADEYSVAVARVVLANTSLPIVCSDKRILWFFEESDRIEVVEALSTETDKANLRIVPGPFEMGYTKRDWTLLSSVAAFQNLFFWQAFTEGKKGPFKYVEVALSKITGVGGILSLVSMVGRSVAPKGYIAYLQPGCTRYPEDMLCKYFRINPKPSDATDENTIKLEKLFSVYTTSWYANQYPANFDESILDEGFAAEMREYADAILGGKKTLGVLARGTDYLTSNLGADRTHATVAQMIPVIKEWMEEEGYERIFLATEDQDNFDQMKAAFPGKILAISQERMSVSDLKKSGSTLIYEFEQKSNEGSAYIEALEDTTVNYFYALYILSRCEGFLCSGQCNGWDTVRSLNGGKFERERKLAVAMDGDPEAEKWKEIRPITAGMFARGTYPTGKAFYLTFRYDLKEKVDPAAIKTAWDKTLEVYPYFSYAVETRKSRLVLLENPLPFVIEETGEVIEPFGRAGNFHTVTFCYLNNTLWIYVDHVPTDGTGFRFVTETFFYHYYCALDGVEYPVPEGVHTAGDGALEGQEIDAYRMVDAMDPKALAGSLMGGKSFLLKEAVREEMFLKREDCRGYCISVASDEFMTFAKAVKGSPQSVLSVMFAKAVQRVHPENKLPVKLMTPVSVRKVMGNENSLLHQVVHGTYDFDVNELATLSDEELNTEYRAFMKGLSSEQSVRMLCGIYRGICEAYEKAFATNHLDDVILQNRSGTQPSVITSYIGTMRTGEYGSRIRMTAFHAMQEKGIMIQMTEVGGCFYIDWYQGLHGDMYAKAFRDLLKEAGMKSAALERIE